MKLGLYSITYLGLWYRGEALTLPEMIVKAKEFGYDGIEIDGKRRTAIRSTGRRRDAANCDPWPTARGSTSSPSRPTTISAIRSPRCGRPRSVSSATLSG